MKKIAPIAAGLFLLILSACGAGAEATPVKVASPTETSAPPSETPLPPATETAIPATPTPAPTETSAAPAEISFTKDVVPILGNYCTECHGVEQVKEGLNLTSYDQLMAGSFNGVVIVPGNANESLLADMISKGKMPKRGAKPTADEIQVIINWINAGALNN